MLCADELIVWIEEDNRQAFLWNYKKYNFIEDT